MGQLAIRDPNILIVGAGAVGQTYGFHLARGGARVSYLVKDKYRAQLERGFLLYRHRLLGSPRIIHWSDFGAFSLDALAEVGEKHWDQVWLCIPSTGLAGEWLEALCAQIGEATLVSLLPGLEDFERIDRVYDPEKIVSGLITLIAYQAPLPGEELRPGVAFFVPPMTPTPFSQPASTLDISLQRRAQQVVRALKAGGCPARADAKTPQLGAFAAAVLVPSMAGLEAAGWTLKSFRKSPLLALSSRAAREAQQIAAAELGAKIPFILRFIRRSTLLGTGLGLAPRVLPFDLEAYLKFHFSKVGQQTRQMIAAYIRLGEERELPTRALSTLGGFLADS